MIGIFIIEEEKEVDLEVDLMIGIIDIIDILGEIREVDLEVEVEVLIVEEGNFDFICFFLIVFFFPFFFFFSYFFLDFVLFLFLQILNNQIYFFIQIFYISNF